MKLSKTLLASTALVAAGATAYAAGHGMADSMTLVSWGGAYQSSQQNAYVERYNRTVRYSWLSQYLFDSIKEVQDYATHWLWFYNNERPNKANGGLPPVRMLAAT